MVKLPPPDPYESPAAEPPGLDLTAPTVVHLAGPPDPAAERLSSAILSARPGALVVVAGS